jgi:enoyl-CoA hydratase/carnithine racemase
MTVADLDRRGQVAILRLTTDQNLWDTTFVAEVNAALDAVEADSELQALVTVGAAKCYSNGYDLEHVLALGDGAAAFLDSSRRLLGRLLTFSRPTVAAINGHAFGIGAMFALAHDLRVMRADRGWFCLPEVDLGLPFHPFMTALIAQRLGDATALEAISTGRRYTGPDALAAGFVASTSTGPGLVDAACAAGQGRGGKDPTMVGRLKRDLYGALLSQLDVPEVSL